MVEADEERLLQARAHALAQPLRERGAGGEGEATLVFQMGSLRAGVPLAAVERIQALDGLVRVPCAPPFVAGVLSVLDHVWAVLDLREQLGQPRAGDPPAFALLLRPAERGVALAADDVETVRRLPLESLAPPPEGAASGIAWVRGITPERVLLLDPPALLADPQLIVDQEE